MSEYKIVLLGSGGVGKSAITTRYILNNFEESYDPTIEDSYRKQVDIDQESCILDILDTAGQEEYVSMRDDYIRSGEGFILVYSMTDATSFEEMRGIFEQILRSKDEDYIPVVLCANKCDLEDQREVTTDEGKELSKEFGCHFMETSAKAKINVEESFHQCVRLIKIYREGGTPDFGDGGSPVQEVAPTPSPAPATVPKKEKPTKAPKQEKEKVAKTPKEEKVKVAKAPKQAKEKSSKDSSSKKFRSVSLAGQAGMSRMNSYRQKMQEKVNDRPTYFADYFRDQLKGIQEKISPTQY